MKFFFAMACVLGLAASCFAQNADTNATTTRTSGIQAARAAALRALKAHDQGSAEGPATSPALTSGTLTFSVTINLHPGFPSSGKIYCYAYAETSESASPVSADFSDDGEVAATMSGSTATCTVTLIYGWYLATPSSDSVGLGVTVGAVFGTKGTIPYWENYSTWSSELTSVPASGSTTTEKVATSL